MTELGALAAIGVTLTWFGGAALAAGVAHARGRSSVGWFFGALLCFTPLLALIALAALPRRRE